MFFVFHKPCNVFSNKAIRQIGRELSTKKIGHTGTLDPLASGLMLLASHEDTKLLQYITHKEKTYIAECEFFYTSISLDNYNCNPQFTGKVEFSLKQLQSVIEQVSQQKEQIPPQLSAKKINGKRAHELLRKNEQFQLKPQPIKIHYLKLLTFDQDSYKARFEMKISQGGYVRSILRDIASALGTTCVMTNLVRTKIGNISLDDLTQNQYKEISFEKLINLPYFEIDNHAESKLKHGNEFDIKKDNGKYLIVKNSQIISIGEVKNNKYYPKRVFNERF
ncbi:MULTISPECIES: tRNA pseudouridine(55) synthase TruB [unclassified Mycoplasma]|uniref:tRNA pseudouridine(55) synthase TruB n=1 Tax=unclassified Mycoplasma TaxID=2683645 RepID=UPI00211C5BFA|nr:MULTISPECIES: tRNA pseudouridine(55) synthase TruB [unclassified Mycoplasma]UUM19695.1 tRNA pseudouridine(55) synthase TruB [Mycoplasma sp. 1578d]UUM24678.1 tRNA pseudouridine(55) synthase TruB [Mycoplasma sp. 3686d]